MTEIVQVLTDKKQDHLRIEYMVGNYCNYKCWYFGPHANGGTHRWHKDVDFLLDNFRHLFDYYIKHGKTNFELNYVGGEPALWPEIGKFTKALKKDYDVFVTMTTNGSRTLRWWEQNAHHFDKIRFSCHPEFVDIDHYIKVLDLVYSKGIGMNALILMDPTNWDKSVELIERCKTSKYPWFINAMEVFSQHQYTEEQRKYISKNIKRRAPIWWIMKHENIFSSSPKVKYENGKTKKINRNYLSLNDKNYFKGWVCNLGLESINIQKDGRIAGACHNKLFGMRDYYNIYDINFKEKFNPRLIPAVCEMDRCWCQPEQLLTKSKLSSLHPSW